MHIAILVWNSFPPGLGSSLFRDQQKGHLFTTLDKVVLYTPLSHLFTCLLTVLPYCKGSSVSIGLIWTYLLLYRQHLEHNWHIVGIYKVLFFLNHAFGVMFKISVPNSKSRRSDSLFSFKSFVGCFYLTFRSIIHFELIFM